MRDQPLFYLRMSAWTPLFLWIALFWSTAAHSGDVIYFKDGMRTRCHGKAWEEKDEVHCEYGGSLLIYPKKDVSRIERNSATANVTESRNSQDPEPAPPETAAGLSASPSLAPAATTEPAPMTRGGMLFYDPRRAKKYWSSESAHHDSYAEAISALAAEFNRPAAWIETNMGEGNDLLEIRDILAHRSRTSASTSPTSSDHATEGVIEFYNPRRPKKYWTSPDARHDTLAQAIDSLAAEFGKPADWIELHMGDVNDVAQIRRSLKEAQAADPDK